LPKPISMGMKDIADVFVEFLKKQEKF